jgi:hypothetical protein
MFALRGDHFVASLDELDLRYRIEARNPESRKPNYLCGHDYQISREGIMTLMPFDKVTEQWAAGTLILPDFQEGVTAHRILFAILEAAGCPPPYRFT